MKSSSVSSENKLAKNIMVFILVMALSGLADLLAEIVPTLEVGSIEIGISIFWFVPLTLCILFFGWWAALAVPIGEIVFSDLVLGEFGGLGEFQEVVLVSIALFIASALVKDPRNQRQLLIAGLVSYFISELPAAFIDMAMVWIGVEEFEAVEGLPQSVFTLEMIDFAVEYAVTGVIFGVLPTLWLAPRLHGKIEPLMGLRPRTPENTSARLSNPNIIIYLVIGTLLAGGITVLSAMGINLVEWEPEFLDQFGDWFRWVAIGVAAVVTIAVLLIRSGRSKSNK